MAKRVRDIAPAVAPSLVGDFSRMPVRVQTKLSGGSPADAFEEEAERVSDEVMNDSRSGASMEQRFGHDFSAVRVHAGTAEASRSARDLAAHAYTVGHDIVFAAGRFAPGTREGQRLLAHELMHVVQQRSAGPRMQRAPDPALEALNKEAAELEKEILGPGIFGKFTRDDGVAQSRIQWIVAKAKTKPPGKARGQRNYYLEKLKLACTAASTAVFKKGKAYGCSPANEAANKKAVADALKFEKEFWDPMKDIFGDVEEKEVATGTNKVARTGKGGKIFYVDRTDPKRIRVKMKVLLTGDDPAEIEQMVKLEDAIERASHTTGYYLDIEFVKTAGPDVFEIKVEFCEWANAGNWSAAPTVISHEAHHALGLPDRYDYIEIHAKNPNMTPESRIEWFVEEMKKTADDPRGMHSKMGRNANPLLSEDVCAVAFEAGAEREKCIRERKGLDPAGIPPL